MTDKDEIKFAIRYLKQGLKSNRTPPLYELLMKELGFVKKDEVKKLEEQVAYLKDNLRVARKDKENLQLKIGKGLQEFIKDCPYTALKFYANEKYVEENIELKETIRLMNEQEARDIRTRFPY